MASEFCNFISMFKAYKQCVTKPKVTTKVVIYPVFSSRLKIRISLMSVDKKRLSTALPKLPVPPVIISVFPAKMLITIVYIYYFKLYFIILFNLLNYT